MDKDRLTPEELASKWNISESTLSQWRWTGKGPKFVKIARQITYKIKEIEAFEDKKTRESTTLTIEEKGFAAFLENKKKNQRRFK